MEGTCSTVLCESGFSRETEPVVGRERDREREKKNNKEFCYQGIMEAEKSHNLPSASWGPRIASGVVERPECQRANGVDTS